MQVHEVEVTKVDAKADNELSDTFFRVCVFCDKVVRVNPSNFKSCLNLSGKKFYCPFCLRNNYQFRSSRNILPLSFRGIIGYYYHRLYDVTPQKIYFCQIEKMIERHAAIGLQSPALAYDPNTYLWFADFNKIGTGSNRAPFDEVVAALKSSYGTFDLKTRIGPTVEPDVWEKFNKALKLFYEQRKRPKGKRMLIPTLVGSVVQEKDAFFEQTREFVKTSLVLK